MSATTRERELEDYRPIAASLMEPPNTFAIDLESEESPLETKTLSHGLVRTFADERLIEPHSLLDDLFVVVIRPDDRVKDFTFQTSAKIVRLLDHRLTVDRWDVGEHVEGLNEILPRTLIAEMRILTGYSNERLAMLLSVDRRSLTNWANGRGMHASKADRIRKLARFVRYIDRGLAERNEAALLAQDDAGRTAFELLKDELYDEAARVVGKGDGRAKRINLMKEVDPREAVEASAQPWTVLDIADGEEAIAEIPDRPAPKMTRRKARKM